MSKKNKKYCEEMGFDCEYFFICQNKPKKIKNSKIKTVLDKLDLSYVLLQTTGRKIIKYEFLTVQQTKYLARKYKNLGLKVVVLRYKENIKNNLPKGIQVIEYDGKKCAYKKELKNRNNIIVAAKNSDDINKFIKYENLYYTYPRASIYIGKYLGYPQCCIKSHYKKIFINGNFNEVAVDEKWRQLRPESFFCPLVNNRWPLFSHYFCSFKCKETHEIAHRVLSYISKKHGKAFIPFYFNYIRNLKI